MDNTGAISLLNMGLGKTRAVLPMLVLHWTSAGDRDEFVPRIHFLQPLLSKAQQFLHSVLTASVVLRVPTSPQPFHLQVEPDQDRIGILRLSENLAVLLVVYRLSHPSMFCHYI
jgi:hypothetical protein